VESSTPANPPANVGRAPNDPREIRKRQLQEQSRSDQD
jgi:hypothetical protein